MSDLAFTLHSLHLHPVKSCAGVEAKEAMLIETGLEFDRAWMIVDEQGGFLSQRELPRMQLVRPTLRALEMVLRASGMLALHIRLDTVEHACRVTVWDDEVAAFDMGDLAAQWFTDFLGRKVRMVRFDPQQRRLSSRRWTGDIEAENAFSDGYPLLVASIESLADLNRRLAERGEAAATMQRFRPNLVLQGLDAHGEDFIDEMTIEAPEGPVVLKLVKPCARCSIPNVDPATGECGAEPGLTLASYRADDRVGGAVTFGMNAVIVSGVEHTLHAGAAGSATIRF